MRKKQIEMAGTIVYLQEQKIKELKKLVPKLEPALEAITKVDTALIVDALEGQMHEIFPELKDVDLEECYPSEIEEFVEAWIEVNFTGVKRLLAPVLSLANLGSAKLDSDLGSVLDSQTIGKGYLSPNSI